MFKKTENKELTGRNEVEKQNTSSLKEFHLNHIQKWGVSWNHHSLLTLQRQSISRVLYYDNLYKKIVGVPGCILEFGVQWGATLAQLISLRGIYEPYNYSRHIYGFDTFEGFVNTSKDRDGAHLSDGDYCVYDGYENQLVEILSLHEANCPISHIRKFSLIKGDASHTSKKWLEDNPHAIAAMVIFDMDIYKPTKNALETIMPRLTKGSVLVFDELNCPQFPGETQALEEVLTINKLKLQHDAHQPNCAWAVWGDQDFNNTEKLKRVQYFQKLLRAHGDKKKPRRKLTAEEAERLNKLEALVDKLKRGENVQNRQLQTWLSEDEVISFRKRFIED